MADTALQPWKRTGRAKHRDAILSAAGKEHHNSQLRKEWNQVLSQESLASGSGTPSSRPKQVEVSFEIEARTTFGSEVRVVGSSAVLGAWVPEAGLALLTSPGAYPLWSARTCVPVAPGAETIEYKFVVVSPDGSVIWEDGPNRVAHICLQTKDMVREMASHAFSGIYMPGSGICRPPRSYLELPSHLAPPAKGDTMTWRVNCSDTCPGDRLFVVGASPALGAWSPLDGLQLATSAASFPVWHGTREMGCSRTMWKVVCVRQDRSTWWEDGHDRTMDVPFSLGVAREWTVTMTFRGGPAVMTEVAPGNALQPPMSPPRAKPLKAVSPQTSVGSGAPGDDSDEISTIASDCEEETGNEDFGSEPSGLRLNTGAHQLQKSGGRCEDAYFCAPQALGVADGVGQMHHFSKYGVDSAAYALGLMDRCYTALRAGSDVANIGDAQERAAAAMRCAESEVESYGASTICLLCLEGSVAGVANLGDSGFMVLRKDEGSDVYSVLFKSDEQQHGWNFPFQLMRIPPALAARVPPSRRLDSSDDCERYSVELMPGDLVLLYTDGLADNLHRHEILDIVDRHVRDPELPPIGTSASAEAISRALALKAQEYSLDDHAEVPFNVSAREFGHQLVGGKADDITVVAAWVSCEAM